MAREQEEEQPPSGIAALAHDVLLMTAMLTRLPVPVNHESARPFVRSVWAIPLIGAAIGGGVAAVGLGILAAGATAPMAVIGALAFSVLLTGVFHEDGLADSADGLGGGRDRESKRRIMKDSRLGTYGAVALLLAVLGKGAAMIALTENGMLFVFAIVAAAAFSRALTVTVMGLSVPAGGASLTAAMKPGLPTVAVAIALGCGAFLPLGWQIGPLPLVLPLTLATAATALTAWIARRQIGGHTGDILGAAQVVGEIAFLYGTVIAIRAG